MGWPLIAGAVISGAILAAGWWIWAIERQLKKPHKGIGER